MRNLFLLVALATFGVLTNAQVVIPVHEGAGLLQKSGEKIVLNKQARPQHAPKKAASLDNTTLWGYFLGDIYDDNLYVDGAAMVATYYVGYYVPGDGILKGSSINGINIPIYETTNMSNVSVWISADLETNLVSKDVDVRTLKEIAFNAIALDEPFAIPESGVYVGMKFNIDKLVYQSDAYPLILEDCADPAPLSFIMKVETASGYYDWYDYSFAWGYQSAIQLFCSNLTLPERNAYFKSVSSTTSLSGAEVSVPAVLCSDGSEGVSSIDYVVDINGTKTSKHIDFATPIEGGLNKKANVTLSFTAPEAYGAYTANISIEKVNGNDNSASDRVYALTNKIVTKMATRKTVVEEFTGTGCGWCPRGWLGMENLKETQENFIGIAFHKYNQSDPMYVANYYSTSALGISGAPGCTMDRKLFGIDPYYGSDESIVDDFNYCNAILPDVDVTVSGTFNEDNTAVDITANVEYLTEGDNYTIAYVLTADSLTGTTSAWMQQNYYYANYPTGTGDPVIDQFCRGGQYGSGAVTLTFNDVMIGSSYNTAGANLAPALGQAKAGATETASYTVSMPTNAELKGAIHDDEVYAVVLVIASDGSIANAAKAKVKVKAPDYPQSESGVYMGIISFNDELNNLPISNLNQDSKPTFTNFVDNMEMKNATLLYYAVDQAITTIKEPVYPSNLTNAMIVTFTDGLDQGSLAMAPEHLTSENYAKYLADKIASTTVQGVPLKAYTIGLKGGDVADDELFMLNLTSLSSKSEDGKDYAHSVTDINGVQEELTNIYEELYKQISHRTLSITVPMMSHGDLCRFTLDGTTSPDKVDEAEMWIEGVFDITDFSFNNVKYHGLTSASGSKIIAERNGVYITFKFSDCRDKDGSILDVEKNDIDQWTYISSRSTWQHNVENDKDGKIDIEEIRTSAAVMFVLDCSSSLGDLFPLLKQTANSFIDRLAGGDGGITGIGSITISDADKNAPVEYYNLQGVKIANPQKGVYIRRQGNATRKVVIK